MLTAFFTEQASYQLPFCDRFGQARLDNGRWLAALTTHIAHEICRIAHSIAQTTQQETQVLENKALLCAVAEYVIAACHLLTQRVDRTENSVVTSHAVFLRPRPTSQQQ